MNNNINQSVSDAPRLLAQAQAYFDGRNFDACFTMLVELLTRESQLTWKNTGSAHSILKEKEEFVAGFSTLVLELLSRTDFLVSPTHFVSISRQLPNLFSFFSATKADTNSIFELLSRPTDSAAEQQSNEFKKLLLLYPGSNIDFDIKQNFSAAPVNTFALLLAYLSPNISIDPVVWKKRNESHDIISSEASLDFAAGLPLAPLIAKAWMECSYFDREDKHDIKPALNNMLVKKMAMVDGIDADAGGLEITHTNAADRPTILVPLDAFDSGHPMFRTYSGWITELGKQFRLIALANELSIDPDALELFDGAILWGEQSGIQSLPDLLAKAQAEKPAICFFPSIGMNYMNILLANLRIAPLQVASLGHPATTASKQIDVMIGEQRWIGNPERYSENTFLLERGAITVSPATGLNLPAEKPPTEKIQIAIPGAHFKLQPGFIEVCQQLVARHGSTIQLCLFSNVSGSRYVELLRSLEKIFPQVAPAQTLKDSQVDSSVILYMGGNYPSYMSALQACQIHMATFPFGGTTTLFDSMLVGNVPVIMDGEESHESFNADFIERAGLPDWLIANSIEEYVEAVVRLVKENDTRNQLSASLGASNVSARFSRATGKESQVGRAFTWMMQNTELIRKSKRQDWKIQDID